MRYISRRALSVAAKNSRNLGATVQFYHADILKLARKVIPAVDTPFLSADALREMAPGRFDIIVSNPPYVTLAQKGEMLPNVVANEPHRALFVPDTDPLRFYRAIGRLGARWLKPGGALFFEINEAFAPETAALLSDLGYTEVSAFNDLNGKERMISAIWPTQQAIPF